MASSLFHGTSIFRYFAPLLILLGFVNKYYCHVHQEDKFPYEIDKDTNPVKDFILCRKCGVDVVNAGFIIKNLSPKATVVTNQTLFGSKQIEVQYLVNPLGIQFRAITLSTASCFAATDTWLTAHSWYPGYSWKPCVCRQYGHQLGWMFEPTKSATPERLAPSDDGFYLLIVDNLIGEEFAEMSDEQKEFLALCEEEFKDRYTENDKEFMRTKNVTRKTPPIVDPWYNKPRRPLYDWSRQNREQGQGERRNHRSDRRNNETYDRCDRHAGRNHQRNSRPY